MNVWDAFLALVRGDLHKSLVQARVERERALCGLHDIAHETKHAANSQLAHSDAMHRDARESIHSLRNLRTKIEAQANSVGRMAERAGLALEETRRENP